MMFSVIIPALNEAEHIAACIRSVRAASGDAEIIVVDGGSVDATTEIALSENASIATSRRGRGAQLNRGAELAHGNILVFLHADTDVSRDMFEVLESDFRSTDVQVGTCRLAFDMHHPLLRFYSLCARLETFCTTFGDQCIACRKSFFDLAGGFEELPLFEDVAFFRTARKKTRIHLFPTTVVTSARRFRDKGIVRQQLRNAMLLTLYAVGVSPSRLALRYYQEVHADIKPTINNEVIKQTIEGSKALCDQLVV
jgi:rSAM/selenodomain-associated transferase 2